MKTIDRYLCADCERNLREAQIIYKKIPNTQGGEGPLRLVPEDAVRLHVPHPIRPGSMTGRAAARPDMGAASAGEIGHLPVVVQLR